MNFKKVLAGVAAGSMVAAMAVPTFADNTEYHAYLCFQTESFSFRNACDDATYGIASENDYGTVHGWDSSNNLISREGQFTDATITGDGTYTVSVSGLAFTNDDFATNGKYNLIFVSTDIPSSSEDAGVTYTIDEVKIGGKVVSDYNAITNYEDVKAGEEDTTGVTLNVYNMWGDDNKTIGAYDQLASDMSITFTVKGLDSYSGTPTAPAYGAKPEGDVAPVAYLAAVVALAGVALVASKKARA